MGSAEFWLAGAGLIVTIFLSAGGVIWKLAEVKAAVLEKVASDKTEMRAELDAMRMASFMEYKELRHEITDLIAKAYRELGEAPRSLREHVNSMELWMRDNLLPRKEYERDQDQVLKAIDSLRESMDRRFDTIDKRLADRDA